jgi:hypothetical protein
MEQLNLNKAKPKKEGGFSARIEAAMKEQQRLAEAKQKQGNVKPSNVKKK